MGVGIINIYLKKTLLDMCACSYVIANKHNIILRIKFIMHTQFVHMCINMGGACGA